MRECLDDLVINKKRLVLGICVGMQIMAKRSDEGVKPGLGWIDAEVNVSTTPISSRIRTCHIWGGTTSSR